MSKTNKAAARAASGCIEIKSKFEAEFRRFGVSRRKLPQYDDFHKLIGQVHRLDGIEYTIWYADNEGDLLPISNNDNFAKALTTATPILRVHVQRKGQYAPEQCGTLGRKPKGFIGSSKPQHHIPIGLPEDFRRVSAIIDVDIIPETHRRVRLMKNGQDRPLGFYIRDGTSIRVTSHGLEKVPGIFISRLVPGGLAESTGLLAVNDEVLEVNGIEVAGKTLDQVTDMMVANSSNLIITVKPVNQHNNISPRRGGSGRSAGSADTAARVAAASAGSGRSSQKSIKSVGSDEVREVRKIEEQVEEIEDNDEDIVQDYTSKIGRAHV